MMMMMMAINIWQCQTSERDVIANSQLPTSCINLWSKSVAKRYNCLINELVKQIILYRRQDDEWRVVNETKLASGACLAGKWVVLVWCRRCRCVSVCVQVRVVDAPRAVYRGLMVDVARNFHDKSFILRLLDVMAMYKMNVLHLHLTDNQGWRIEVPTIPQLTDVNMSLPLNTCLYVIWEINYSIYYTIHLKCIYTLSVCTLKVHRKQVFLAWQQKNIIFLIVAKWKKLVRHK